MMEEDRALQGARRVALLGRDAELEEIEQLFRDVTTPTIYYLEGRGGVGKTVLLEEALHRAQESGKGLVASRLIDLYHTEYQTATGLAMGIYEVLGKPPQFMGYVKRIKELRQRADRGLSVKPEELREVWDLFADALSRIAKERGPLLIALDTTEILAQVQDPFQSQVLREGRNLSSLISRGAELLSRLKGPILWLLAGRPSDLKEQLEQLRPQVAVSVHTLAPLSPKMAQAYLLRVAENLGEEYPSRRLRSYAERYGPGLYRGTKGEPILLAMVADILRVGGELPPVFFTTEPLSDVEIAVSSSERQDLERTLIQHLLQIPDPMGETLRVIGLLRKGANEKLLARLMGIEEVDARANLQEVGQLALVKHRPQGERPYFLHDELYSLFDRYGSLDESLQQRYFGQIVDYYQEEEENLLTQVRKAADWEKVELHTKVASLRAERLHYHLRASPKDGFETYFGWAEDVLDSRNDDADILLHSELWRTVPMLDKLQQLSPSLKQQMEIDAAIRWGIRPLLLEESAEVAEQRFRLVREWCRERGYHLEGLRESHLRLYESVTAIKQGKFVGVKETLLEIEQQVSPLAKDNRIAQILQAFVWAYLGYIERLRGVYYRAVEYYQKAVYSFRRLRMGAVVSTLSNLAYAMAMVGQFDRARQSLEEAERRAKWEGLSHQQAVAMNVRSIVEAMDGHSRTAVRHADKALELLNQEEDSSPGLRAMIYTNRSRAHRYLWNTLVADDHWYDEWKESLWASYEDIKEALAFDSPLNYYLVERWNEAGCVYRELTWALKQWHKQGRAEEVLGEKLKVFEDADAQAEYYFLKAAGVDGGDMSLWEESARQRIEKLAGNSYLPVLALVNLGWHWYYRHKPSEKIESLCQIVERLIPEEYHLPQPTIDRETSSVLLWSVLGKKEMLRFYQALRKWRELSETEREAKVQEGVSHLVYALEYDRLIGISSYDLRRAEEGLHHRIIGMPKWEEWLLPGLYRYGKEVSSELQKSLDITKTVFMQWLEERFGPADLWIG